MSASTGGFVAACLPVARKFLNENLEAAEGCATKTVDGLVVVADGDDISMAFGETPEEFELRDIRVLKFVDENISEAFAKFRGEFRVGVNLADGVENHRAEREQAAFAQQLFAGAIGARDFLSARGFFGEKMRGVRFQRGTRGQCAASLRGQTIRVG